MTAKLGTIRGGRATTRDAKDGGTERELDLVARARRGDVSAWSSLYLEHFDGIYRHLRYLTGDSAIAEDLTQETFARALVALSTLARDLLISSWLHGIALNMARQHWRGERNRELAHSRLQARHELLRDDATTPRIERLADLQQRALLLYEALERLPDTLREVFILRDLEGLRAKEVSKLLRISTSNVHVRLNRARARIQAELEARGVLPTHRGPAAPVDAKAKKPDP
ncbi:MAG: RNA polymerase sigma factor [Myxococcales bacterium]|nr:RNA polymerase sigma factor [Myxococcales bacterium]